MIDQVNADGTGWARFSDDMTRRYRLARSLTGRPITTVWAEVSGRGTQVTDAFMKQIDRVVFVMLNPSTADAFKHDPTVGECIKRARALGADVLEIVNLFAIRTPYPADVKAAIHRAGAAYETGHHATISEALDAFGAGPVNDAAILEACRGAEHVIAAWGNHGEDLNFFAQHIPHAVTRGEFVRAMLVAAGVELLHLGTTACGAPKHPLARGKHRIPADLAPVPWSTP